MDLYCVTQQVSGGRAACIPGHCPFTLPHRVLNIARESARCPLMQPADSLPGYEVLESDDVIPGWGNSTECLEIHFRAPKPGSLPHHCSTLDVLKALCDTRQECIVLQLQSQSQKAITQIHLWKWIQVIFLKEYAHSESCSGITSEKISLAFHTLEPRALFTQYCHCMWGFLPTKSWVLYSEEHLWLFSAFPVWACLGPHRCLGRFAEQMDGYLGSIAAGKELKRKGLSSPPQPT